MLWLRLASALVSGLVVAMIATGLALQIANPPLSLESARARWKQQQFRRYQIEMQLDSPWRQSHLLLIVEDNRLTSGLDLETGRPLTLAELASQSLWMPVDRMFDRVGTLSRQNFTWQERLGGLAPELAREFRLCLDPPTQVRYHPDLGYPIELRIIRNTCTVAGEIHLLLRVNAAE